MLQKLKIKLFSLVAVLMFAIPAIAAPAVVMAASPSIQNSVCSGANDLQINNTPSTTCGAIDSGAAGGQSTINRILTDIINIFSVVVGVIAVIMIIIGGFRYVTSGGQAEKITSAKNTILYALIGLIIVALAQIVVKFVLTKATTV